MKAQPGHQNKAAYLKVYAQDNKESKGDDKALYSKSTKSTGSTTDQVKSWLPRRVQKLVDKGRLKVVQSVKDISDKAYSFKIDDGIEGFYDPDTDTMFMVAEQITQDNVNSILQHELYHRSEAKDPKLKEQLGKLDQRLNVRFKLAAKGKGSEIENAAYKRVMDAETPVKDQLVEYKAYLVSEYNTQPESFTGRIKKWAQDFIAAIRAALIRQGIAPKNITAADLNALAKYGARVSSRTDSVSSREVGLAGRVPGDAPVIETDGGIIAKGKTVKEMAAKARQYAQAHLKNKVVHNIDSDVDIKIPMKGIKHTPFGAQPDLLKSLVVLPEILSQSKHISSEPDKKQSNLTVHYYGVKLKIDDKVHDIVAVVKEDSEGNRYYDHSIERTGAPPVSRISETPADLERAAEPEGSDTKITDSDESSIKFSKTKGEGKAGNASWRNQKGFDGLTDDQFNTLNKIGRPPGVGFKAKIKNEFEKHRYLWRNKLRQGVVDQYDSFASVLNDKKAWMMASLSNTGGAVAEAALEFGRPFMDKSGAVDIDTKEKSLAQIVEPLGDELDRFLMWIAGNRAEGLKLDGRENLFSDEDISNLKGLSDGEIEGKSRKELYNKVRIDFERMHNAIVKMGVDTGLVSKKDAAIWKEQGFYVPFYRLADESVSNHGPQSISGLVRQQAYKKLKGADMQLNDLLGNTLMNWNHLIGASLKNQAAAKALNSAVTMGLAKEITATQKGKNSVFMREDGKEKWFDLDGSQEGALVLDSLTALNYDGLNNTAMKAMRKFKRALTIGVTASPEFKIANLIRDSLQAIAVADMSTNIAKNLAQGFKATGKDSDTIGRMIGGGGAFGDSGYIHGADPDAIKLTLEKGVDRTTILDSRAKWKKVWDLYQDFGSRLENVNRAANFEQDLAEGKDLLTANFNARDHLDFQRTGSFVAVRAISQMVPFINARAQGLDKLGRSMVDPKQRKQFAAVVGSYAMASIALYLAMKDDDDYQEAEQWERDTYHLFKVPGSDVMFRIPRPFEVGAIANMLERGAEQMVDDKVHGELFAERLWHSVTETFAMNPMPQLFKPVIETWANKNSFTGRGIESQAMQRLSKSERKKAWTSQTAIGISKAMDAILWDQVVLSPVQVEHLVNGYLGWVGATTLSGIDMIARPLTGAADKPDKRIEDYPVIGRFVREGKGRNSRFITEFYENQREINQHYSDIKRYRDNQEYDKYNNALTEYRNELKFRKYYNRTNRRIALVNKQIRLITANKTLGSDVKRRRIDKLNASRIRLAKKAVDKFERLNR